MIGAIGLTVNKQQIMSSRAFGAYAYDLAGLEEAVATYVGRAAEKLRGQGSLAGGVMLLDLTDADRGNSALMRAMDRINACWGRGTLRLAAEGVAPAWRMRRRMMSPCYTTRWAELPVVG